MDKPECRKHDPLNFVWVNKETLVLRQPLDRIVCNNHQMKDLRCRIIHKTRNLSKSVYDKVCVDFFLWRSEEIWTKIRRIFLIYSITFWRFQLLVKRKPLPRFTSWANGIELEWIRNLFVITSKTLSNLSGYLIPIYLQTSVNCVARLRECLEYIASISEACPAGFGYPLTGMLNQSSSICEVRYGGIRYTLKELLNQV